MRYTQTIAHIVYSFGYGGLERVIVNLVNNSQVYDVNHIIITLTDVHDFKKFLSENVKIYCLYKAPGNDIKSHIKLYRLLKKIRPHAIQTYNFGTLEYQVTAALSGVKVRVHSEHGRGGDKPNGLNTKNNLFRKMVALLLDNWVVVSPDLHRWAKEVINLKDDKLKLVFNGVNMSEFKHATDYQRPFTYCTVGRADKVKNQTLLIEGYAKALIDNPDLSNSQLRIVGDGPELGKLKTKVKELNLENKIDLTGYRDDVANILANCDVFVLSSVYEAMPMTILEAMASSLPVISTKVGGVGHLLTEDSGWLVPSKDVNAMASAMTYAFTHQDEAKALGIQGRKMVQNKFSLDTMVDVYMDIYRCKKE